MNTWLKSEESILNIDWDINVLKMYMKNQENVFTCHYLTKFLAHFDLFYIIR